MNAADIQETDPLWRDVCVIVPTFLATRADNVRAIASMFVEAGAWFRAVANSQDAAARLEALLVPTVSAGTNLGFARSVAFALESAPARKWIIIINDDVELQELNAFATLAGMDPSKTLLAFGEDHLHRIPSALGVFLSMSMLSGVWRRAGESSPTTLVKVDPTHYPAFSCVSIGAPLWGQLNGMDQEFPFMYEDTDFSRRMHAVDADLYLLPAGDAITHTRGVTGRAQIDVVLPVVAWSARHYLAKWYLSRRASTMLVWAGLVCRIPLIPFARTNLRSHFIGTLRAIRSVNMANAPELPGFYGRR